MPYPRVNQQAGTRVPAVSIVHIPGVKGTWKMAERHLVPPEDLLHEHVLISIYFMNPGPPSSIRRSRISGRENPYLGARPDKGDDALLGLRKETLGPSRREFPCQASKGCGKRDVGGDTKHLVLDFPLRYERLSREVSRVLDPFAVTRLCRSPNLAPVHR